MKNGTYNCVICFSLWGVVLRIAILCETLWGRGQNTTPHCNFNIQISSESTQNTTLHFGHIHLFMVCFLWDTHHTVSDCHFEASDHYFALWASWCGRVCLPHGVVWGQNTLPPPVILWIRGAQGLDCLVSVHCLSVSVSSFHCHFQIPCFSSKALSKIFCTQNKTARDTCSK